VRIGLACPYTWDVPGGVQVHVRDLAESLMRMGHEVSVITPVDDEDRLPPYAVSAGKAMSVPYNGSVTRILFGPVSASRVRRWIRDGEFDVVHAHEPTAPSTSLLACLAASGPLVATYHTSNPRSRILTVLQAPLQLALEKVWANIAVSEAARRTIVEHLGVDAVLVPNGVDVSAFATATPLIDLASPAPTIVFVGRIDEPRKGLAVLLDALPAVAAALPEVRLLVAGPGEVSEVAAGIDPALRRHVRLLGLVSDADKPRLFRTADVYVAPNTGQESFGIVLLEAMAARTPVVASNIDAFRRVLDDGRAGRLFANSDPADLARVLIEVLTSRDLREELAETGWKAVQQYDWSTVATEIVHVYETVTEDPGRRWL
jgi:phosphatidyl-myo-inositol alpha-mannosyltransferase